MLWCVLVYVCVGVEGGDEYWGDGDGQSIFEKRLLFFCLEKSVAFYLLIYF